MTITAQRARERLSYDSTTGLLTWCSARCKNDVGLEAGYCRKNSNYRSVAIDGKSYLAHRLIWLIVYGEWPTEDIDHINGVRNDNRLSNLRAATRSENRQNTKRAYKHSTHGFLGATLKKKSGLWEAKITVNGARFNLGLYSTPALASAAYVEAKRRLHPFNTL